MTEKELAVLLAGQGVPNTKIGARLGRDRRTIERWLRKVKPDADERNRANDEPSQSVGTPPYNGIVPDSGLTDKSA